MAVIPDFKLYQSDGVSLVYTFPYVNDINAPHASAKKSIRVTNVRGKGEIIYDGGTDSWELSLSGTLVAADYDALVVLIDAMEAAVALQTAFVIKWNKTSGTYYTYNVKRIEAIEWGDTNLRRTYVKYRVKMIANSW